MTKREAIDELIQNSLEHLCYRIGDGGGLVQDHHLPTIKASCELVLIGKKKLSRYRWNDILCCFNTIDLSHRDTEETVKADICKMLIRLIATGKQFKGLENDIKCLGRHLEA